MYPSSNCITFPFLKSVKKGLFVIINFYCQCCNVVRKDAAQGKWRKKKRYSRDKYINVYVCETIISIIQK